LLANTIIVFTSDHGDMLGSHGLYKKQKPYDESIRVPLLFRLPAALQSIGPDQRAIEYPISSEDLLPTILGLCGLAVPKTAEGLDFSGCIRGKKAPGDGAATIMCVAPFGEWDRKHGGREYRGLRTVNCTYVRDLSGPWLLFDNASDPFQTNNLVAVPSAAKLQRQMDALLTAKLKQQRDRFLPGNAYITQWKYTVDANGTAPYSN